MATERATLIVRVQPGARDNRIVGFRDNLLHVKVTAPPRKGQANQALLALLAEALAASRDDLKIIRGHTSRQKVVAVRG